MLGSSLNQVFLGAGDPVLSSSLDFETLLRAIDLYKALLQLLNQMKSTLSSLTQTKLIWDEIDSEVAPLTSELKNRLFQDEEYAELYNSLQGMVLSEILSLVKSRIEASPEGKLILDKLYSLIKKLKTKIIEESNREMDTFRRFREYTKTHPNATYEEFIKETL